MLILNIFAHLALNAYKLLKSIKHTAAPPLILVCLFAVLLFAQCKNSGTKGDDTKTLEDSLADKYGKGSEVIDQLGKDIAASPDNPELYYRRAVQWAREEHPAKALSDIKHAISLAPNNALYQFALGEIYFASDSITGALAAFTKSTELKPDFTDAFIKLGELQMILFQFSESNTTFDKLLAFDENNATAYYYKGRNYMGMKDTSRAIFSYRRAITLDNDYYNAYVQLGNIYFIKSGKKNLNLSIDYFTNAIRINEASAEAYYARALAYFDLSAIEGDALQKALRDNEKVTILTPDDYRPYSSIGVIYLNLGRLEEAIDFFNKALTINPEYVRGYYLRALTYEDKGDYKLALDDYQTVVKMDDNYTAAKEAIEILKKKIR
jgi:tetratricopeptide (TPR) repeat protein